MQIPDVNVLIYAFREDTAEHARYQGWLQDLVNGEEAFGLPDLVSSGVIRLVTHPRIFNPPTPIEAVLEFIETLRNQPNCVAVSPGPRHWDVFTNLCLTLGLRGRLVPDAYFAALAIESGNEWVTTDRDFARFPGLRWRHPLA